MRHIPEESISAMVDGMLTLEQTRNAMAHMAECELCRGAFESFSELKSLFRSQPVSATLPDMFLPDTLRRMRTEVDTPVGRASTPWHGVRPVRRLGAALAVVSVLAGVIAVPTLTISHHPGSRSAAQDTVDDADFSSFVVLHADTAASQPLADHDRQRLISAGAQTDEQASLADDNLSDPTGNGDTAL